MFGLESHAFAVIASPWLKSWNGCLEARRPNRSSRVRCFRQLRSRIGRSDFQQLLDNRADVSLVILRSCNDPTSVAAEFIRRNAIRIGSLRASKTRLLVLER